MKIRVLVIGLMLVVASAGAQDPIFSQFYNAPNQVNPAFTGNTEGAFVATNYRLQWPGFSSVYNTYMLSYDQFAPKYNSGFGLSLLADDAGDGTLKTTKIAGLYSYRVYIQKETYLKLGMEVGVVQSRLDPTKLIFFDQLDPQFGAVSPGGTPYPTQENLADVGTRFYPDIGAGIMIYSEKFYGGVGLKHLNNPDSGFLEKNNGDAVIGSLGVRSGIFKISYSYDLTVSGLGVNSGGSHELGLIFNFDSLLPKESKYNDCLSLFR